MIYQPWMLWAAIGAYVVGYVLLYRPTLKAQIESDNFTRVSWRVRGEEPKRSNIDLDQLTFATFLLTLLWPLYLPVACIYYPATWLRGLTDRVANGEQKKVKQS